MLGLMDDHSMLGLMDDPFMGLKANNYLLV